jgi:signal transduction histidine kinase
VSLPYEPAPFAQLLLPIGITYTILRHNLFDIDPTARRTLAYAGVSLILLLFYLALSAGLTLLLALVVPDWRGLATLAGLLIAAILFTPLQRALQGAVDGVFYPERRQFGAALLACSHQLNQVLSAGEVTRLLTHSLPTAIAARWAELLPVGATPNRPAGECALGWHGSLAAGTRELGCFWLGPRRTALPYTAGEEQQLQRLMRQAALALAYGETLAALQGLNEALEERVAARTAQLVAQQRALAVVDERQRMARELHDSVSQTLFSINLGLGAIRKMVQQAPLEAERALAEQETAARQALGDMRTLLMQLRTAEPAPAPERPAADEPVDLSGRLHELVESINKRQGVVVSVAMPAQLFLPAAAAATLALVAREALHNVYKHAGVSEAALRVQADGERITLTVEDSGHGGAAESSGAFGLRGMRERMAAIGGRIAVESRPGAGTLITATLPRHQQRARQGNP